MTNAATHRLSDVTRSRLLDHLSVENVVWAGRLEEAEFLGRIYDLSSLPSNDYRYPDAAGDIQQHRWMNPQDWPDDWVFSDARFRLRHGPDEVLLRFLAEMLHPLVRHDEEEIAHLLEVCNEALRRDGYELFPTEFISGHAIYGWRDITTFHGTTPDLQLAARPLTDPAALEEHLVRIRDDLTSDPASAISSCKNLLESLFKLILDNSEIDYPRSDDLPQLYRKVADLLRLNAESVPDSARGSRSAQTILRTLETTVRSLAELRNELGTGHGGTTPSVALARHARLALNATVTVAEFTLDTWQVRLDAKEL